MGRGTGGKNQNTKKKKKNFHVILLNFMESGQIMFSVLANMSALTVTLSCWFQMACNLQCKQWGITFQNLVRNTQRDLGVSHFLENAVLFSRGQVVQQVLSRFHFGLVGRLCVFAHCCYLPLLNDCCLIGKGLFSYHTSSHMPASMIYGCSLSWTKWKVPAFELDKGVVCLPDFS